MLRNIYLSFADFVSHRLSNSLHRLLKIPHQNHSQKETLDHMTSNQHFHREVNPSFVSLLLSEVQW